MTERTIGDQLADRLAAEGYLERRTLTIPLEPLTALAGGILGGTIVAALAWRTAWRTINRHQGRTLARVLRRIT